MLNRMSSALRKSRVMYLQYRDEDGEPEFLSAYQTIRIRSPLSALDVIDIAKDNKGPCCLVDVSASPVITREHTVDVQQGLTIQRNDDSARKCCGDS